MLYDLDELWEMIDFDRESMGFMVNQFIIDVSASIGQMAEAITNNDYKTLKFNAHRIKPAVNSFHVLSLPATIRLVEEKAEDEVNDAEMQEGVRQIVSVLTEVIVQLKEEFKL